MDKNNNFFNIRNKLIIFLLIIIIVPVLVAVKFIGDRFSEYIGDMLVYSTGDDLSRIDSLIDIYLNVFEDNVNYLAENQLVKKADGTVTSYVDSLEKVKVESSKNGGIEKQIYDLYSQFGESNSSLKYVYMGSETGSFILWPEGYVKANYDPRQRPWYKAAMENPGKTVVTDPYDYLEGNITVISIVKTILNDNQEFIGVQGVDISLEEVTDIIKKFKIGKTGYLILTDKNGIIIANSRNPEMNFKNIRELNIKELNDIENKQSDIFEAEMDGVKKYINVYTTENNNFKLISVIEKQELLEQVYGIKRSIIDVVALCVFMALIFAFIFSNQFLKPIFVMKKHLSDISFVDFKKRMPEEMLKRKDEFGDLSMAIESMQNRLENLINEIKNSEEEVKENLNFLQVLIDTIPSPIFSKDENGVYNHCNNAFSDYFGIDKDNIIGYDDYDISDRELADIYRKVDYDIMHNKGKHIYETKVVCKDGTRRDVLINKAIIKNHKGEIKGMVGVMIDISKEKANQEKINKLLKIKEIMLQIGYFTNETFNLYELFKLILDKVIDCIESGKYGTILVLDDENKLRIAVAKGYNQKDIESFKLDLEKSVGWLNTKGRIYRTVIVNKISDIKYNKILDTDDGRKINSIISSPIVVDDKLYGFINLDSSDLNAFGATEYELMEYVRHQLSVTVSKHKLYEETIYLSKYDKLTNLYNRSYFEQLIYTDIYESVRQNRKMLVAVLDLNGLKIVNDSYGHLAGDIFIKTFAAEFKNLGTESNITARFGGDEFIAVIYDRSQESLTESFEKIIIKFKNNPVRYENNEFLCSFSYGISSFPDDGDDFNILVKIADKRMYECKRIMKAKMKKDECKEVDEEY